MKISYKKFALYLLILIVICFLAVFLLQGRARLKGPESIAFDGSNNRFLISNTKGKTILSMDENGKLSVFFKDGLVAPKGIAVSPPYLYIADQQQIVTVDIPTASLLTTLPIEGSKYLNDIALDDKGLLYVTDTEADAVFVVNVPEASVVKLTDPNLEAPNGIVFDRPRKQMMIVSSIQKSPIMVINTETQEFGIFTNTIYSQMDGIAIDDKGRIYFSSWDTEAIYMIPQEQNRFEVFKNELPSPADFYYHQPTQELIVPLWEKNKIERFKLN
ncbi:MAG TPA: SMP-30/gluconolactonase/LRE family protein [Candidatus Cloacimonadota bacterium]|nr:SMP-30/gluconolactonase/LRE family protein [Candidatus Cloacimonadota bacterium]